METLKEIIYPIEVSRFLDDYWNKKHLLIRNTNEKFKNLFTYKDLSNFLNTHSHNLEYPEIRVTIETQHIHPKEYIDSVNFFVNKHSFKNKINPKKLKLLLDRNASIALSDIQDYNLKLQRLAYSLSNEVAEQVNINLYYSQFGKNTFKNHSDPDPSFIIQLEGEKKWTIFEAPKDGEDTNNLTILNEFTMRQGDVLYLPRGVWHNAQSTGTSSLSINITLTSLKIIEFLMEIIDVKVLPHLDKIDDFDNLVPTNLDGINNEFENKIENIFLAFKKEVNNSLDNISPKYLIQIINTLKENKKDSRSASTFYFPFDFEKKVRKLNDEQL